MNKIQIIVKTQVANFLIASVYYLYSKNKGNLVFSFLRKVYYSLLKKFGMSVMPILDFDAYHTNYNCVEVIPIKSKRIGLSGNCVFLDNIEKQKTIPMPLPDIRMHKLSDVTIFGNSDVVVDLQKKIITMTKICSMLMVCYIVIKIIYVFLGQILSNLQNKLMMVL